MEKRRKQSEGADTSSIFLEASTSLDGQGWPRGFRLQTSREIPGGPVVRTPLPLRGGARVLSLVGELRSRKLRGKNKYTSKFKKLDYRAVYPSPACSARAR